MSWLTEDPTLILALAIVVEAVLVVALLATRLVKLLVAIAAVGAVAGALLLIESLIVTDREQISDAIERLVANAKAGDVEGVIGDLSPGPYGLGLRAFTRRLLPSVRIDKMSILKMEIQVDQPPSPDLPQPAGLNDPPPIDRWARVEIDALVTVKDRGGGREEVTLLFVPEGERWALATFEHYGGFGNELLRGGAVVEP